ncbi:hypothetical protein KAU11_12335, partial [Candidatus Babeliales bacterium]|nr:hypothetical protein [Candidatus Babeliales bacterium]
MKKIQSYKLYNESLGKKFINESLKDKLKGKSEEDVLKSLKGLSDNEKVKVLIKYGLYDLLPDGLIVHGDLYLHNNKIIKLPNNLTVTRNLYCNNNQLTSLP